MPNQSFPPKQVQAQPWITGTLFRRVSMSASYRGIGLYNQTTTAASNIDIVPYPVALLPAPQETPPGPESSSPVGYRPFHLRNCRNDTIIHPSGGVVSPTVTVVETTVGVVVANAVQTVTLAGSGLGGTFTLTFGGQTTSAIAYNASSSQVQTALGNLSTIGTLNVSVSGSSGATGGTYTVTFINLLGNAPQAAITYTSSLTGTTPTITINSTATVGVAGTNEQNTITVSASVGYFQLSVIGNVTQPIPIPATAQQVQTALQTALGTAIASKGGNEITVTGIRGGPYLVTFGGALANQVVPLIFGVNR